MIGDNLEQLHDIWSENDDFIKDVLGSDRYKEGEDAYKAGDIERLKELLQDVSDELDNWIDDAKDDFIKDNFVTPDSFEGWGNDKW